MQLSSDIVMYNPIWRRVDEELCTPNTHLDIFGRLIDIYVIACAIGIMDDCRLTDDESDKAKEAKTIGRNTHRENQDVRDVLDLMLQIALIRSKTIKYDEDERLKLAFDPDYIGDGKIKAAEFLTEFANYGITKIYDNQLSDSPIVAIDQLHSYFDSIVENIQYGRILISITLDDLNDVEGE